LRPNRFDLYQRILLSGIHARTFLMRFRPALCRREVLIPERPGSALERANRVNGTEGLPVFASEEDAVTVGSFGETVARTDTAKMLRRQPAVGPLEMLRDAFDFLLRRPDVARFAAAAIAALSAGEAQAVPVPFFSGHGMRFPSCAPIRANEQPRRIDFGSPDNSIARPANEKVLRCVRRGGGLSTFRAMIVHAWCGGVRMVSMRGERRGPLEYVVNDAVSPRSGRSMTGKRPHPTGGRVFGPCSETD
jgi:hypothetical protein